MTLAAGSLNSRIEIQHPVEERDDYGDVIKTWQTHATVWANIRNISGKEYTVRGLDLAAVNTSIRIRLRRSVNEQMRVLYRRQIYNIVAVLHDEARREHTDLVCQTGANDGR